VRTAIFKMQMSEYHRLPRMRGSLQFSPTLPLTGSLVHGQPPALGLRALVGFISSLIAWFVLFCRTILNPEAAQDNASRRRGGGGGGGGGQNRPRGPRITGLSDLRDASGGEFVVAVITSNVLYAVNDSRRQLIAAVWCICHAAAACGGGG
jgi:hypothetical protein